MSEIKKEIQLDSDSEDTCMELFRDRHLNDSDLAKLMEQDDTTGEAKENMENYEPRNIDCTGITKIINSIQQTQHTIRQYDPLLLRREDVTRELEKSILMYREFLAEVQRDNSSVPATKKIKIVISVPVTKKKV